MPTQPRAKKSLGQHFLRDKNICHKIVDYLEISPEDRIIEIGPGPGALSDILAHSTAHCVLMLEKDHHWALERQKHGNARTQAVLTDALTVDWARITKYNPWKCIGNLPYNIASVLMWDIFSQASGLTRAVFMVQKEVGDRLTAAPGSKAYGALSVWVQSFVRPRTVMLVRPSAFVPPPKVDSSVLTFTPLPPEQWPTHPQTLARLVKLSFQNRRKQLGSIFRQHGIKGWDAACQACHIRPEQRPETLAAADFQSLANFFRTNNLDFP